MEPGAQPTHGVRPVEIRVGSLVLRPFQTGDADAVLRACQDPEIQRWTTVPVPYTRADAEAFVAGGPQRWASGTPTFAVEDASTGEVVAAFDLKDCSSPSGPMIGFWVEPGARRRGIAATACRRLAEWAITELKVDRVQWAAYVGNHASQRVARAAGFTMEGTLRKFLVQRGRRHDAWIGSLLAADLKRAQSPTPARVTGWPYEPVELRTERLLLRRFRDADAPSLLDYARDAAVMAWDREDTPDMEAALRRARSRADWTSGKLAAWAIAPLDDSDVLGGIVIADVDAERLAGEVGYGLLPHARGHGFTAEALRRVTEWALTETGLERISLLHAVENEASCAVATSAGYAIEGILRRSDRFGDGELHDEHLHSRLRTDPAP